MKLFKRKFKWTFDIATWHFGPISVDEFVIQERIFPYRSRVDLKNAVEDLLTNIKVVYACGIQHSPYQGSKLSDCLTDSSERFGLRCTPFQYQEIDVGEDLPVRCHENGLWMIETQGQKLAMLLSPQFTCGEVTGVRVELAGRNQPAVLELISSFFKRLEDGVYRASTYRGKILSLSQNDRDYSGQDKGIKVHRLKQVDRDQVILPSKTLELLERNIIGFVQRRERLRQTGLSTQKGLLFYGPPGTGKTHTIHYLSRALPGHTTLIISAEQINLLEQYMTLARLLQPSIVVIEDADLIARDRNTMSGICEEVLLHQLLNHMDGLQQSADILFILTTNRPEMLEPALAARPGRIDQAIEFPLPDIEGRRKLINLYGAGIKISETLLEEISQKTQGVSAAFIKELMRRAFQFQLESETSDSLSLVHVDSALDEMLFRGGLLNRKLLGATEIRGFDG